MCVSDNCIMFRYKGYCPQLKYNFGKTFGQQTYELSKVSYLQYIILAYCVHNSWYISAVFASIPLFVTC